MIHVIDNYYIKADDREYTLVQKIGRQDKDGNEEYKTCPASHCRSIQRAVRRCRELIIARAAQANNYELAEIVEMVKDLDKNFEEVLEKALAGRTFS